MYPPDAFALIRTAAIAGVVAWVAQIIGRVVLSLLM